MEVINTIFYFAITIGILVLVHELGHFAAAKLFGMRVDRFSIGFPPRAFGKKIGETDYCISWIPIGGYVKIAGMIDESFDTAHLQASPQPWEFRSKPVWQRMIVLAAGVFMNLLLAVAIFWFIIYSEGKLTRPVTTIGYVVPQSAAEKAGLQVGDKILTVNGEPVKQWDDIEASIYGDQMGNDIVLDVERAGTSLTLSIPRSSIPDLSDERFGIFPTGLVAGVARVEPGKPAAQIGLKPGDVIRAINGKPVSFGSLSVIMKSYASQEITLTWTRGSEQLSASVIPTAEGRIGIALDPVYEGPVERIRFTVFGALRESVRDIVNMTGLFIKNIYSIIAGRVSFEKSVGGPLKIAQLATRSAELGLVSFLTIVAWLSLSLAILNLLPFPALDGGHLMFLMIETVTRREIPNKVKLVIQQVGIAALLVFMAFVLYNDIVNF
jgi:regulator of sigma E protease